jgi:hypothetical protein
MKVGDHNTTLEGHKERSVTANEEAHYSALSAFVSCITAAAQNTDLPSTLFCVCFQWC